MNPVTETNAAVSIPRTDAFMQKFNARMKFLLGEDVRLGTDYSGWESLDDHRYEGCCRAVRYDGTSLYVFEKDTQSIVLLCGDAADYKGGIIADRYFERFSIPQMHKRVSRYMEKHGVEAYRPEIGHRALWVKMAPQSLVRKMVGIYELGRGLVDGDTMPVTLL